MTVNWISSHSHHTEESKNVLVSAKERKIEFVWTYNAQRWSKPEMHIIENNRVSTKERMTRNRVVEHCSIFRNGLKTKQAYHHPYRSTIQWHKTQN